ncbi:MAG: hypothetical protein BWY88_01447 [Synergistetes bacterium ADurb.Bin520]|nr:MAG: hypothetical protein BWY88_01447 [Synergistetes bacterium ADurb.Bin520]
MITPAMMKISFARLVSTEVKSSFTVSTSLVRRVTSRPVGWEPMKARDRRMTRP